MTSTRFSNVLTVILILVIVGIIGLLVYFGVDVYNKYYIDKEASDAVSKFEEDIMPNETINNNTLAQNTIDITDNSNIIVNEVKDDSVINQNLIGNLNTTTQGGSTSSGSNNVKYYKGFVMKGTIEIPKTGAKYPILATAGKKEIEVAVGILYPPNVPLNSKGNIVISGHNYRNGQFFSNNKKLENGDKIYITDETGKKLSYTIYNKYETTPEDAQYMSRDTGDNIEISLSTCTDDNSKRLIIWAKAD